MSKLDKLKKTVFIAAILVLSVLTLTFTSCVGPGGSLISPAEQESEEAGTFQVVKGDIVQQIFVTGTIDSESYNSFKLQVSGQILKAAETGDSFSKGDVLVKVDDTDAANSIVDVEKRLEAAKNSLAQSRVNYQSALDSNHIAIQLAELDEKNAELSAQSALDSLAEASKLADVSSENAKTALEISQNSFNTSVVSLQQAEQNVEYAQAEYDAARADADTTDERIRQLEDNVETALKKLQQAELSLQSSELSLKQAETSVKESKIQSGSQVDSAQSSYEQSQVNQSSTYWSTLEKLQNAEKQIQLTALSMQKGAIDVEISEIDLVLKKEELENYTIVAPYEGIVVSTDFRTGEEAGSGAISIINSNFLVSTLISESDIINISEGAQATVNLEPYPDSQLAGVIKKIKPVPVEDGGIVYYETLLSFENTQDLEILYGLSADISIITQKAEDVLYVPLRAVYKEEGRSYVDVLITDEEGAEQVKQTEISTGINDYTNIEVTSGLTEGDIVITSR